MLKSKYYLFILFCMGLFISSKATHNRAGEITYKWLFGYTYQIKITIYTEIGGANMPDRCEDTLCFGDGTIAVVLRSNGNCNGPCSPACEGLPLAGGTIKLNEYVTTHTYAGPGYYKICVEDPNRTAGVVNIPNSVNQVFYLESYLIIPIFGSGHNSSPVFNFPPLDNGCTNNCFYHNPGAYDLEGDSISYELTFCRGSMGVNTTGYSYPNSGVGGTFNINSVTGTLTWCTPQLQGDYNVATLIKEWRKDTDGSYFLVGSVLRDAQFTMSTCTNIKEIKEQETLVTIFPNPITENFTVTFNHNYNELFTIDLFDVAGRKIKTFLNNESLTKQNTFQLILENIHQGIYFLKITGNHGTNITKKIIKQ